MELGLAIFATDRTPPPHAIARLAEDRGFESLFFPDHTHIPASRETPFIYDTPLPDHYPRCFDPFVAMASAAAVTERLRVGAGVCLLMERDPIVTAKQAACIDHLSGGRLIFGVGAGWNHEEMRNHGTDPGTRFRVLRERVEAVREIWSQDEASYSGEFVSFERIWSWPKPVQKPHPPILIGGWGPKAEERVLAYGDGWVPRSLDNDDELLGRVARLRERAGRPVPVTIGIAPTDTARLARYREAGIDRCYFYLPSAGEREILDRLDEIEYAIRPLR
jgi:probable F420-dependent oxidoreductase